MSKLFKTCLISVGILAIIIIAGIIILVTMVNPNRYKDQIAQQIYKNTGRHATIGTINWSVFPWIKLQVNNVILDNPQGFPTTPFISVGQAAISVNMMALLKREVIVDNVAVSNMQVNLIRTLNGSDNWTLTSSTSTKTPSTSSQTNNNKETVKSFNINAISISNTTVNWQDATKNQNLSFQINSLKTNNINVNGKPFNLDSSFVYQATQLPKPVNIKLSANITANKDTQQYNLNNLEVSINQFSITGKAQVNQTPTPTIQATLSIPTTDLATLLAQLGYPIHFQNQAALTKVGGDIALIVSKNSAQINNLTINLDGAKINGQANMKQLNPLQGNFTLAIDQLNLDQYQTVPTSTTTSTSSTTSSNTTTVAPAKTSILPSVLQTANITGKLTLGTLQVSNMQLQQVNVPMTLKNSEMVLSPITAEFYQGTLQTDIKANYAATTPIYSLSVALNNVNMNAFLQQAANFDKLTGTGQINFVVNTTGTDKNSILSNLNGNGKAQLSNGSYVGLDLINAINNAASLFLKQAPTNTTEPAQTNFTALNASFEINNGLVDNQDLTLTSPVLNVTGNGTLNLVTQLINYNLSVEPTGNVIPQVASLEKAIGGSIPVKVQGPINNPKVTPDMEKISMAATKKTINQNLKDVSKGVDDFSKGVAKTLNQMFGN